MKRVAVCVRDGEDGVTVVAVVPRGHVAAPYVPLGLNVPASVVFSDCVALGCRVHCDGTVSSLGPPRDLPPTASAASATGNNSSSSSSSSSKKRRLDPASLRDAVGLFEGGANGASFKLVEEFLCVFGVRLLDRPYLMMVSAADRTLELPLGHFVYRVKGVEWIAVTPDPASGDKAPRRPALSRKDGNRLAHFLSEYSWAEQDSLLFADLVDICSVFPFGAAPAPSDVPWARSQRRNDFGCDWGASLRSAFDAAGVGALCSPFTRGFALGAAFTIREKTQSLGPLSPGHSTPAGPGFTSPASPSLSLPQQQQQQQQQAAAAAVAAGPSENVINFMMMGQQNTGNPGPRFFGRGLNDSGAVGNDLVYQLVAWKYKQNSNQPTAAGTPAGSGGGGPTAVAPDAPAHNWEVQWSRHVFLRGTAPVRFKSKLGKGIGEATIVLMDDAIDGSAAYLASQVAKVQHIANLPAPPDYYSFPTPASLARQASAPSSPSSPSSSFRGEVNINNNNNNSSAAGAAPAASEVPSSRPQPQHFHDPPRLRCINLLKAVSSAGENKIGALFDQVVRRLAASAGMHIDIEHVDWLGIEAKFGINASAACIWNASLLFLESRGGHACTVGAFPFRVRLPHQDFTTAELALHRQTHCAGDPPPHFVVPHVVSQQQNRFLRYNCADSLDRTNLASFFVVAQLCAKLFLNLQVMPERLVSRGPANPGLYEAGVPASPQGKPQQQQMQLDGGGVEGEAEGLDEVKMPEIPPDSELPPCYFHTVQDMTDNMPEPLLRALVELFVTNGDTIATMFTGTAAIHTSHMRKLVPDMRSAAANALISMQRRYENVLRDKKKYRVLDMIVGKETKPHHFPTVPVQYFVWPLPRMLWTCAVLLRCNAAGAIGAFGVRELQAQLPEAARGCVVEIREAILAVGRDTTVVNANAAARAAAVQQRSRASTDNNAPDSPASSAATAAAAAAAAPASPSVPVVAGAASCGLPCSNDDDDVPANTEHADFSFLTFDRFYAAVVLLNAPAAASALLALRQVPLTAPDGSRVVAELKGYAYEFTTDEPPSCLRARAAARSASESSPITKISNFLFGGKK